MYESFFSSYSFHETGTATAVTPTSSSLKTPTPPTCLLRYHTSFEFASFVLFISLFPFLLHLPDLIGLIGFSSF
ncbi:hypothetical protein GBA52_004030 [Prunus armeniaca]|nr:hypothetical protein GBA52_004030 [Prunus armeniaca]